MALISAVLAQVLGSIANGLMIGTAMLLAAMFFTSIVFTFRDCFAAPDESDGSDGADYVQRLDELGVQTAHIGQLQDTHTAQCMIMTDRDNNQITAFHPGAMMQAHGNRITPELKEQVRVGIIAPDGRQAMLEHAQQFKAAGIPFVFDPGQGLPMFDGQELRSFIEQADWVAVNDYEARMLSERTGWSLEQISRSEEHTSELQSPCNLVCRLLLE